MRSHGYEPERGILMPRSKFSPKASRDYVTALAASAPAPSPMDFNGGNILIKMQKGLNRKGLKWDAQP